MFRVYRIYGEADELLYVGASNCGLRRVFEHEMKPWWRETRRISFTPAPSLDAALATETKAIKDENPKYNVRHSTITAYPPGQTIQLSDDIIPLLKNNAENKEDYWAFDSDLTGFGLRFRRGKLS